MIIIADIIAWCIMLLLLLVIIVFSALSMSHLGRAGVLGALGMQVHISLLRVRHFTTC